MSTDLTVIEARAERDALADRTDVLDKVGVLRMLPDDAHCNTDMVASFYEVSVDTLYQVVKRNRDELDDDGYQVVGRAEVTDKLSVTPDELGMPRTAGSIGLYPRRAVLRIGMLLRDSEVARRVRDVLLDVEQDNIRFMIPKTKSAALYLAAQMAERAELAEQQNKVLEARIEKDAPLVAKAEAHSRSDNAAVNRQTFAREVQQWGLKLGIKVLHEHVYELLRRKGMLIAGNRSDRNNATSHAVKSGWAWTHKETTPEGFATATTYLRARGQDLAWKWITEYVDAFGDLRPRGVA